MTAAMKCPQASALAESYVAGTLLGPDREAFELHYMECTSCFDHVSALYTVRGELETQPQARKLAWPIAAAAIAAALAVAVWLMPGQSPTAQQPAVAASVKQFGRIDPPVYRPVNLRGAEDDTTRRFNDAMRLYQQHQFDAAVPLLTPLAERRVDAAFFLAACQLLTGSPRHAAGAARQAIAFGDTPYQEEAKLILAKALLAMEDVQGARGELEAIVAMNGEFSSPAKDLLSRLPPPQR